MTATVGSGKHTYAVNEDWAQVPDGWHAPMAAVTVDSQDRVYGFNRGARGVIVFNKHGEYLYDWGEPPFRSRTPSTPIRKTTSGLWTETTSRY